jgi:putative colanic acid biosynthesis acetyltransferase WcaF
MNTSRPNDQRTATPPAAPTATAADRAKSPYSFREKVRRVLWDYFGQPMMRLTFHDWYGLRASWLRMFGATIGKDVRLRASVRIEIPWNLTIESNCGIGDNVILYCLAPITLEENCTVSQYAHLCAGTHDYTRPDMPLVTKPIVIGRDTWLAADVFVGPGVRINHGCVVGARSSVYKDLEPCGIYAGNPARKLREREGLDDTGSDTSHDEIAAS